METRYMQIELLWFEDFLNHHAAKSLVNEVLAE